MARFRCRQKRCGRRLWRKPRRTCIRRDRNRRSGDRHHPSSGYSADRHRCTRRNPYSYRQCWPTSTTAVQPLTREHPGGPGRSITAFSTTSWFRFRSRQRLSGRWAVEQLGHPHEKPISPNNHRSDDRCEKHGHKEKGAQLFQPGAGFRRFFTVERRFQDQSSKLRLCAPAQTQEALHHAM